MGKVCIKGCNLQFGSEEGGITFLIKVLSHHCWVNVPASSFPLP